MVKIKNKKLTIFCCYMESIKIMPLVTRSWNFFAIVIFLFNTVNAEIYRFGNSESTLNVNSLHFNGLASKIELCDLKGDFVIKTNDVVLRMNNKVFDVLAKLNSNGSIKTRTFTSDAINQWYKQHVVYNQTYRYLWEIDNFEPNKPNNWTPGKISTCGDLSNYFLGGPCILMQGRVYRIYNGLPQHSKIKITGIIHFFDKWEGEGVSIKADGVILHSEHHNWCPTVMHTSCKKFGIDICGQDYPDRLSVYFSVEMDHAASQLSLEFQSGLKSSACTASWGIDDIALFLR
ncbi:hypothetical protein BdWA1_002379 [Babesia duncani]|uniref:Uncharacterized protein n=1 Tax=Babesia duncani TaxID=323732 RepID=A0AAD9PJ23_9APIC|nr:hypothetical protein BdWA1_002379 [Babesia duncani]